MWQQPERSGCCSAPKWAAHCIRQQSINWHGVTLCADRERNAGDCLLRREVQWLHIWKKDHCVQRPQATGSNPEQATSLCPQEIKRDEDPPAEIWPGGQVWERKQNVSGGHAFQGVPYLVQTRFASKNIHWPICFKIYNHSVSPNSKKYSQHELKTRSSALTKCIHTWQLLLYIVSMQYIQHKWIVLFARFNWFLNLGISSTIHLLAASGWKKCRARPISSENEVPFLGIVYSKTIIRLSVGD